MHKVHYLLLDFFSDVRDFFLLNIKSYLGNQASKLGQSWIIRNLIGHKIVNTKSKLDG